MAEHIVARALRTRAEEIASLMPGETDDRFRNVMAFTAGEFHRLADQIGSEGELPLAQPAYIEWTIDYTAPVSSVIKNIAGPDRITLGKDRIDRAAQVLYNHLGTHARGWLVESESTRQFYRRTAEIALKEALT